jgi:hypothetical protein
MLCWQTRIVRTVSSSWRAVSCMWVWSPRSTVRHGAISVLAAEVGQLCCRALGGAGCRAPGDHLGQRRGAVPGLDPREGGLADADLGRELAPGHASEIPQPAQLGAELLSQGGVLAGVRGHLMRSWRDRAAEARREAG